MLISKVYSDSISTINKTRAKVVEKTMRCTAKHKDSMPPKKAVKLLPEEPNYSKH